MKVTMLVAMAVLVAAAGQAEPVAHQDVKVYMDNGFVPLPTVVPAKMIAAKMFADIGVRIQWRWGRPSDSQLEREGAILVQMADSVPGTFGPNAMAFAKPFDRVHVTIFFRVEVAAQRGGVTPQLMLAHVFVHEMAHLMQGLLRHSDSGIMRARWMAADYAAMRRKPLSFTLEDVEVIYRGLEFPARAVWAASRDSAPHRSPAVPSTLGSSSHTETKFNVDEELPASTGTTTRNAYHRD